MQALRSIDHAPGVALDRPRARLLRVRIVDQARPVDSRSCSCTWAKWLVLAVVSRLPTRIDVATVHPVMVLGGRQSCGPLRLDDLEARSEPGASAVRRRIHIDADPIADPAGAPAAVSQT